jgi:putative redox protein
MDVDADVGGTAAAVKPIELVLLGLGGCTSMDILSILGKKKVFLDDYWVNIDSERSEEHPRVFTKINLKFVFIGKNVSQQAVERAIELSVTKYCSVIKMLEKSVEISTEYNIIEK